MPVPLPRQRQVHLDFHTSPDIPGIGAAFDAAAFAETFKNAHVNSVTVFAKCHHGHLYFPTRHPAGHPHLKPGLDLCGEQVEALHRVGIRAPVYISVQCDEFAADTHPEWIAQNPDGSHVGPKPLEPGWQILDLSSPYLEYLEAQTEEICKRYQPVDGVFFDMCWNQPSVNPYAVEKIRARGLDPTRAEDRERYAAEVADHYMGRLNKIVRGLSRDGSIYFNSRPLGGLPRDIKHLTHTEIEALPTGGWGYMYFPRNVRYVRTFGKPYLGMTARFHKSWGDFGSLKPEAALRYELCQMIAHGAACSVGDQLHPDGRTDRAVYDLIGRCYAHIEACEPWTDKAKPLADIGLFRVTANQDFQTASEAGDIDDGATRMLTHLKSQFNVVDRDSHFADYKVLILPDAVTLDAELARKLETYMAAGGAVLATGVSGLDTDRRPLLDFGAVFEGESPYKNAFLRFADPAAAGVADTDHVLYERSWRIRAKKSAETPAMVVEPYFDRDYRHFCSHFQTPNQRAASPYAAALLKGRLAYAAFPAFSAFGRHGYGVYRRLIGYLLDRLLPEPLLRVDAPSTCEATILRQGKRTVVHLLQFVADRRNNLDICEDIIPLSEVSLSVALPKKPAKAYLAPSGEAVPFRCVGGRVEVVVPRVAGHGMVVFE